jgi:hypothetical protein
MIVHLNKADPPQTTNRKIMSALNTHTLSSRLNPTQKALSIYDSLWKSIWGQTSFPTYLLELCRLRLAKLHRADAELAYRHIETDSLSEEKIQSVINGDYDTAHLFSDAELAVLSVAELYAIDPSSITDHQADAVKNHYGESGFVFLIDALGVIDCRIKLAIIFSALYPDQHNATA